MPAHGRSLLSCREQIKKSTQPTAHGPPVRGAELYLRSPVTGVSAGLEVFLPSLRGSRDITPVYREVMCPCVLLRTPGLGRTLPGVRKRLALSPFRLKYLRREWRRRRRAQAKYQRARIGRGQRHHARGVLPRRDAPARRGLPDAWGAAQRLSAGLEDELVLGHAARRGAWCIAQCVTARTACAGEPAMRCMPVDDRVVGIPLRCITVYYS